MVRKLLAGLLLTTFLVATTGFVLTQCCCDKNPKKECCRSAASEGCKTDVSYFKLKVDFQAGVVQQLSFFSFCVVEMFESFDTYYATSFVITSFNDTGPPNRLSLTTLSRLQVFRI